MAAAIGGQKSNTNIFSTFLPPCRVLGSPLPPLQYAFCVGKKKKKSVLSASVLFTNFYITDLYQNSSTVRHIPKVPQCKHPSWDSATEKTDNNFRQDSRSEKEDIYCCDTFIVVIIYYISIRATSGFPALILGILVQIKHIMHATFFHTIDS